MNADEAKKVCKTGRTRNGSSYPRRTLDAIKQVIVEELGGL